MSQALRKMTGNIKQSNTLVIFINQIRMKIGVMFGSQKRQLGQCTEVLLIGATGRSSNRSGENGDEVVGNETRVKVVKNKVAPPFRQTEFQILYGQGIHRTGEILELGVEQNMVEKSGAWYSYNGERNGQGRKNAADFLDDHPDLKDEIESRIRQQLMPALGGEGENVERSLTRATQHLGDSTLADQ